MKTVDLSIDFDFFIREKAIWDFGHRENSLFLNGIWDIRYSQIDLVRETDIKTFADFEPYQIMSKLEEKGLKITKNTEFFLCESHLGIVTAFRGNNADMLISMDAHHDMFGGAIEPCIEIDGSKIDCGSWLNFFTDKKYYKKVLIVYPKWKDINDDLGKLKIPHKIVKWDKLPKNDYEVKRVFLCRSGCWVPPHHDKDFSLIAFMFSMKCMGHGSYDLIGEINPTEERNINWDNVNKLKEFSEKAMRDYNERKKMADSREFCSQRPKV